MRKSVQYLVMFVLPDGAEVGIVTYSSEYRVEHRLTVLTDGEVRLGVADSLPDRVHLFGSEVCGLCGVRGAIEELWRNGEDGAEIILVRGGEELSEKDKKEIEDIISRHGLKISSIGVAEKNGRCSPFPVESNSVVRRTANQLIFYKDLLCAMIQVMRDSDHNAVKFPEVIKIDHETVNDGKKSVGSFIIDNDLGEDTFFAVLVEDVETHGIESVQFEAEDGEIFGPYLKMSSVHNLVNMKTVNWERGEDPPFDKVSR